MLLDMVVRVKFVSIDKMRDAAVTSFILVKIPVTQFNPDAPFKDQFHGAIKAELSKLDTVNIINLAYAVEYEGVTV